MAFQLLVIQFDRNWVFFIIVLPEMQLLPFGLHCNNKECNSLAREATDQTNPQTLYKIIFEVKWLNLSFPNSLNFWTTSDTLTFTLNIMYYKIILAPYMLWLHQVDISFGGEVGISYVVTFGWFGAPTPLKYLNPLQCFENQLVINFLLNIPNLLLKCGIGNNDLSFSILVVAQCLGFYS